MPPWDLIERTRCLRWPLLKFCRRLPATPEAQEAGAPAAASRHVGASQLPRRAKGPVRAEFRAKLQTAFEEADECVGWLEYLRDARIQEDAALLQEARELASILATVRADRAKERRSGVEVDDRTRTD